MVFIYGNGDVCEDDEYYGIFYEEEQEEQEEQEKQEEQEDDINDFIDNTYKEDMIYEWEHKLMLV